MKSFARFAILLGLLAVPAFAAEVQPYDSVVHIEKGETLKFADFSLQYKGDEHFYVIRKGHKDQYVTDKTTVESTPFTVGDTTFHLERGHSRLPIHGELEHGPGIDLDDSQLVVLTDERYQSLIKADDK